MSSSSEEENEANVFERADDQEIIEEESAGFGSPNPRNQDMYGTMDSSRGYTSMTKLSRSVNSPNRVKRQNTIDEDIATLARLINLKPHQTDQVIKKLDGDNLAESHRYKNVDEQDDSIIGLPDYAYD